MSKLKLFVLCGLQSQTCASVERVTWVGSADHPLQALLSLGVADRRRTGGASLHTSDKGSFGVEALHVSNGSNPWATSGNPWSRGREDGDELWNPHVGGGQRDSVPTMRRYCALRVVNVMRAFTQFRFICDQRVVSTSFSQKELRNLGFRFDE